MHLSVGISTNIDDDDILNDLDYTSNENMQSSTGNKIYRSLYNIIYHNILLTVITD